MKQTAEQFVIWMVGLDSRWASKPKLVVIPIIIHKTEKQAKMLAPPHSQKARYDLHHSVAGYRTMISLNDPCLQHRTPEAAISYWHEQNAESIATMEEELADLKALDAKQPEQVKS